VSSGSRLCISAFVFNNRVLLSLLISVTLTKGNFDKLCGSMVVKCEYREINLFEFPSKHRSASGDKILNLSHAAIYNR
jgi:hypothetical protein